MSEAKITSLHGERFVPGKKGPPEFPPLRIDPLIDEKIRADISSWRLDLPSPSPVFLEIVK